jgi:hypothetical protein
MPSNIQRKLLLLNSVPWVASIIFRQHNSIQNAFALNHKPTLSTQQFLSYSQPQALLDV